MEKLLFEVEIMRAEKIYIKDFLEKNNREVTKNTANENIVCNELECEHHWEWFAELGRSTEEDGSRTGLWEMICTNCDQITYENVNYDHEA